jgi:hypothetical protein
MHCQNVTAPDAHPPAPRKQVILNWDEFTYKATLIVNSEAPKWFSPIVDSLSPPRSRALLMKLMHAYNGEDHIEESSFHCPRAYALPRKPIRTPVANRQLSNSKIIKDIYFCNNFEGAVIAELFQWEANHANSEDTVEKIAVFRVERYHEHARPTRIHART